MNTRSKRINYKQLAAGNLTSIKTNPILSTAVKMDKSDADEKDDEVIKINLDNIKTESFSSESDEIEPSQTLAKTNTEMDTDSDESRKFSKAEKNKGKAEKQPYKTSSFKPFTIHRGSENDSTKPFKESTLKFISDINEASTSKTEFGNNLPKDSKKENNKNKQAKKISKKSQEKPIIISSDSDSTEYKKAPTKKKEAKKVKLFI
ncbi:uncharacterized protein LOC127750539 isoform X2 [Frankliniella occidentalis]|uniref:Uncharacterized protein LOC127750539 isoform X2 n=1 Tax=Frankliniella occidentalis TaxID=133901 RepID=A0A9C6X3E8_FRAOC|nr:uncharacterized protein LOC127750539 isoform X2 [Frankliniella occidentalis]